MKNSLDLINLFCDGMMFLILVLVLVIVNRLIHPNSYILFGVGNFNMNRRVYLQPTGGMGIILGVLVPFLLLVIRLAVTAFKSLPLAMSLMLVIAVFLLILVVRYFQLALRLDRDGKTETAQISSLFTSASPVTKGDENVNRKQVNFTYAKGLTGDIGADESTAQAIKCKKINLKVTYLEDQPEILRVTQESVPGGSPAAGQEASAGSHSGPAGEVLPAILADLTRRDSGSFVIIGHRRTQRYVQFLNVTDALILDFGVHGLTEEETERARNFFSALGSQPETEGRARHTVYRMDFPPAHDQIDRAAEVAGNLFKQVFLLPEDAVLEEYDMQAQIPSAGTARKRVPLPQIFLAIGLICSVLSIFFFIRYANLMLNRIPVEGTVIEAHQTTCQIWNDGYTYDEVCYAATVQFTSKEGGRYQADPITRFFRPYAIGEKIPLFHQPGQPEGAKPNYNDEFTMGVLPAAFGAGGLFVGILFVMINKRRETRNK